MAWYDTEIDYPDDEHHARCALCSYRLRKSWMLYSEKYRHICAVCVEKDIVKYQLKVEQEG